MKGSDLDRAHFIRQLWERCMDKQDKTLPYRQQIMGADLEMSIKLGPEWANDVDPVNDPIGDEEFYHEVAEMGADEGKGEAPEAPETGDPILYKILELLRMR